MWPKFPGVAPRLVISSAEGVEAVDVGLENFFDLYEDVVHTLCIADEETLELLQKYFADLDIRGDQPENLCLGTVWRPRPAGRPRDKHGMQTQNACSWMSTCRG